MNEGKCLLYDKPLTPVIITVRFVCITPIVTEELKTQVKQHIWHDIVPTSSPIIPVAEAVTSPNTHLLVYISGPRLKLLELHAWILANGKHAKWFPFFKIFSSSPSHGCCVLDGIASSWSGPPDLCQVSINWQKILYMCSSTHQGPHTIECFFINLNIFICPYNYIQ